MTVALVSTNTVTVTPNRVTTVLPAMPAATLITNNDPANAVWISDSPGLTAGFGYRLGPLGTLVWGADGQACYATVDNGVITPVQLTVGTSVSDVTNPVDVAIATATQLLATGVPNVGTQSQLNLGNFPLGLTAGNSTTPATVTKYASLIVNIGQYPTALVGHFCVRMQQFDINGGVISEEWLTSDIAGTFAIHGVPTTWIVPVVGVTVVFTNMGAANIVVGAIGTNRQTPTAILVNQTYAPRLFSYTGALVIGTPVAVNTATDGIQAQGTAMNGEVQVSLNASVAGVQGELLMTYRTPADTSQSLVMSGPLTLPAIVQVPHPLGAVSWGWFPSTASAGLTITANVIQVNRS